jgi:hypothetical protein
MPSTINNYLTTYGDDHFFDESFLILLRSYMPLISKQNVNQVSPTNQQLYKYQGDFYGLLDELGVDKQYHYATLLLNNLKSSTEFVPSMSVILIPNTAYIDMLHSVYTTTFTT